ncbi:Lrp/AsnC family transcriptional regulator [uncultured Friedmanniella sp.]|uniref:Lrp/AsnC family transcriptional regulator n=1 Tax=uncultured Friedmanniella sp. TaxID=335381 RepID=UPI0035CA9EF6
MVVKAYVLVQTEVGKSAQVAQAIADLTGVAGAEDVTGPYDVIVTVEAPSVDELAQLVTRGVQKVPGITRTVTCNVVHL